MVRQASLASAPIFLASTLAVGALERTEVPGDQISVDEWNRGTTCAVTYSNICSGWIWLWHVGSVPHREERIGMWFDPCCPNATLAETDMYSWTGSVSGRGYTGLAEIWTADANGCPDALLAQQSLLVPPPHFGHSTNTLEWNVPTPSRIVITYTSGDSAFRDYNLRFPTDHPAAGPTGPPALGYCYPSSRATHSFMYGNVGSLLCPGEPFFDGVGDAELYLWAARFRCDQATSVGGDVATSNWAEIKNLYR